MKGSGHLFWDQQPIELLNVYVEQSPIIESPEFSEQLVALPYDLFWQNIDIDNSMHFEFLYELLRSNYIEDSEMNFRLHYSKDFLKWALRPYCYFDDWQFGVFDRNNKVVAFISGIPLELISSGVLIKSVQVNFLCIRKEYRTKRLAPLLISELTRRAYQHGIFQALFTGSTKLAEPLSTACYYHKLLNCGKLFRCGFAGPDVMHPFLKAQQPDKAPPFNTKETIELLKIDLDNVNKVYESYQVESSKLAIFASFSLDEFMHWMLPKENVLYSFCSRDCKDFGAFYSISTSIKDSEEEIKTAYIFYHFASTEEKSTRLMKALINKAAELNFDIVNCLNIMKAKTALSECDMLEGDGVLHYYLFNWKRAKVDPSEIGIPML